MQGAPIFHIFPWCFPFCTAMFPSRGSVGASGQDPLPGGRPRALPPARPEPRSGPVAGNLGLPGAGVSRSMAIHAMIANGGPPVSRLPVRQAGPISGGPGFSAVPVPVGGGAGAGSVGGGWSRTASAPAHGAAASRGVGRMMRPPAGQSGAGGARGPNPLPPWSGSSLRMAQSGGGLGGGDVAVDIDVDAVLAVNAAESSGDEADAVPAPAAAAAASAAAAVGAGAAEGPGPRAGRRASTGPSASASASASSSAPLPASAEDRRSQALLRREAEVLNDLERLDRENRALEAEVQDLVDDRGNGGHSSYVDAIHEQLRALDEQFAKFEARAKAEQQATREFYSKLGWTPRHSKGKDYKGESVRRGSGGEGFRGYGVEEERVCNGNALIWRLDRLMYLGSKLIRRLLPSLPSLTFLALSLQPGGLAGCPRASSL